MFVVDLVRIKRLYSVWSYERSFLEVMSPPTFLMSLPPLDLLCLGARHKIFIGIPYPVSNQSPLVLKTNSLTVKDIPDPKQKNTASFFQQVGCLEFEQRVLVDWKMSRRVEYGGHQDLWNLVKVIRTFDQGHKDLWNLVKVIRTFGQDHKDL
ncbi:hypothetical protein CDAR_498261 [Caerostris darwini]|uniref:Uncharacterized protein n=1 Tax=Caerostris darwini TaxID=1538125 RepID=A0AAV4U019_9ARAC|nr:hypothetical protein CDAR_498261 [Caerostris darwini]